MQFLVLLLNSQKGLFSLLKKKNKKQSHRQKPKTPTKKESYYDVTTQ